MSINIKAATFALGVASLFVAGQASAACDGRVRQARNNVTVQCYEVPTMSNGHYVGMQKQVNYGYRDNTSYDRSHTNGATIGTNFPHHVVITPRHPK
jgi:hypothetical protein